MQGPNIQSPRFLKWRLWKWYKLLLKLSWKNQRTTLQNTKLLTRQGLWVSPQKQKTVSEPKKQENYNGNPLAVHQLFKRRKHRSSENKKQLGPHSSALDQCLQGTLPLQSPTVRREQDLSNRASVSSEIQKRQCGDSMFNLHSLQ